MLGIFTSIWRILVEILLLVETHLNVEQNMWKHLWSAIQPSAQPWPWFSFVSAIFHVSPSTWLCSFWQWHLLKCLWIFPFFPCQPLGFLWLFFLWQASLSGVILKTSCIRDNWLTATTLLFGARKVKYCVRVELELLLVILCWENKCGTVSF